MVEKNNYKYRTTNNNKLSGCSRIRKAFLRKAHNSFNKLRSSADNIKINFSSIFSLAKFCTFMLKNFSRGSRYVLLPHGKCFSLSAYCRLQNLQILLSWFGREVSDNDLWKVKVEIIFPYKIKKMKLLVILLRKVLVLPNALRDTKDSWN